MYSKEEKYFIVITSVLSLFHALAYVWLGYNEGFNICILAMIILDVLYIPAVLIKNVKVFPFYLLIFGLVLIYITAFTTSELYNNYTALLCVFVAFLIFPKYKNVFMGLYLFAAASAFCIAGDKVYYLVIHTARALWLFCIYEFIIYGIYNRKPVILFDEEIEILEQLVNENKLTKEIEIKGYSERTIRRRLDEAQKRNGLKTRAELKELYKKTYKK